MATTRGSRSRRPTRRRKSRSLLRQVGAIGLLSPFRKLSRAQAILSAGVVAGIGVAVIFYSYASSSYSLWSNTTTPSKKTVTDNRAAELGVKFKADMDGTVSAVKFYKGSSNTGVHTGSLWTSTGALLATVTFTGETGTGWQTANFSQPVAITAGTLYVASYHTNVGHYAFNRNYFSTSSRDQGPLHAPANTTTPNGVYAYGPISTFPTVSGQGANYWVDIVFTPTSVATPTPVGTIAPTPTPPTGGGEGCALPNYPDASCTGVPVGTTLTPISGDINITIDGTIIEGKSINGCVDVNASNVIIRKSKIVGCDYVVSNSDHPNVTGLLVEDTEIDCGNRIGSNSIRTHDFTARRVNVHNCNDVMWVEGNVTIEDSYIHDVVNYVPSLDNHTDGVQLPGGASNIVIRHNRIYGNYVSPASYGNSAITAQGGGNNNVLIQDNLLAGGGNTLQCFENGVSGTNFRVTGNHFSTIFVSTIGGYGPEDGCRDETEFTGNVYEGTNQAL